MTRNIPIGYDFCKKVKIKLDIDIIILYYINVIRNQTNPLLIMKIQILKNGSPIKELSYTPQTLQKVFNKAVDIAGGLWNGVDKFTVKTL